MTSKTVSKRLRRARKIRGLSANGLDTKAGLSRGHVRQIENGQKGGIELSTASKLADALGISMDWLVSGRGPGPTPTSASSVSNESSEEDDSAIHAREGAA